jgi:hypothetical protein
MLVAIHERSVVKLQVKIISDAVHPSEVVVGVETLDGIENVVVSRQSVVDDALEIGYPVAENREAYLVELSRETMRGSWRLWVEKGSVF